MKRDDAVTLMDHFAKGVKHAGTTTAVYHGYNGWSNFLVKEVRDTLADAANWDVPGLFIAYSTLKSCTKPYLTIFYKMGCGKVLAVVLPVVVDKHNQCKIPNNFTVLKRNEVFNGEEGLWIALNDWHVIGNVNDFVIKKGDKKRQHLAKRPNKDT